MPTKSTAPKPAEHTFETALKRLEEIVDDMEGDRLPLESLLERYTEGVGLLKVCQERLDSAEKKIELVARTSAGKVQVTPFDPGAPQPVPFSTPASRPTTDDDADEEVSLF